jgi:5-bromo-4-chloroindolyl phosphate hydrolysis protein
MTGKSKDETIKELQKMISKGWFRQGHLDENGDTLITSEETYQQYLHTLQIAAERMAEEQEKAEAKIREYGGLTEAQHDIIAQGEQYIAEIRACNKDIPDVDVTAKLDRMVHSVEVIVERAKKQPELTEDMTRLMNYYLPTMVKLLHSYADLDSQGKTSANIEKSKREIEDTIDVMNEAFDRLFDSLFEDTSLDISTDVEVMRTLLSQEGLTGHSFGSNQTLPGTNDQN